MSENLSRIQQSFSVAFADFIRGREAAGRKILKMQTGDPDFATHPGIVRAAHEAMLRGETKYCDSRGLLALREAVSEKLLRENGIRASAKENILITHGAVHGIGLALRALVNPGDEVIISEPYWRSYESNVVLAGGQPILVPTLKEEGFQLKASRILERLTSKTKAIVINSPNNPSGAVYSEAELRKLAKAAREHGVYLICDEVYEALVFEGRHYSPASDPAVFDWIVSAYSFSKTHAMTGWRVGYLVANAELIDELLKLSQFSVTSLAPYAQQAAIAALRDPAAQAYSREMVAEYAKRRDLIVRLIRGSWLEEAMTIPQGALCIDRCFAVQA